MRLPWSDNRLARLIPLALLLTVPVSSPAARAADGWLRLRDPRMTTGAGEQDMSRDGRLVVWDARVGANDVQVFGYDRARKRTELVSTSIHSAPSLGVS